MLLLRNNKCISVIYNWTEKLFVDINGDYYIEFTR